MPRNGAVILSDVPEPTIEIACEPCGRRGRYNVQRFTEKHGPEVKLADLRHILANCPKSQSLSIYDRCHMKYEGP